MEEKNNVKKMSFPKILIIILLIAIVVMLLIFFFVGNDDYKRDYEPVTDDDFEYYSTSELINSTNNTVEE